MDATHLCDTCRYNYRYCDGKPFFAQDSINPEKYRSPHQVVECDSYVGKAAESGNLAVAE